MAEILVRLVSGDDESSFFLTQEMASEIARLPDVVSHPYKSAAAEPGARGDPITLGAIAIACASGGGALTALVGTIGSYLSRDRRTEAEIQTKDGRKVRISSQSFTKEEINKLLREMLGIAAE